MLSLSSKILLSKLSFLTESAVIFIIIIFMWSFRVFLNCKNYNSLNRYRVSRLPDEGEDYVAHVTEELLYFDDNGELIRTEGLPEFDEY